MTRKKKMTNQFYITGYQHYDVLELFVHIFKYSIYLLSNSENSLCFVCMEYSLPNWHLPNM